MRSLNLNPPRKGEITWGDHPRRLQNRNVKNKKRLRIANKSRNLNRRLAKARGHG